MGSVCVCDDINDDYDEDEDGYELRRRSAQRVMSVFTLVQCACAIYA